MRLLAAADDSGSLKEIFCPRGTDTSVPTAPQPKEIKQFQEQGLRNRIQKIIVIENKANEKIIVAARANGQISYYSQDTYDLIHTTTDGLVSDSKDADKFIALVYAFGILVAASEQGLLTFIDPETIGEDVRVKQTTIKGPLSAFTPHPEQQGIYAYGGKENDIKIVRLFSEASTVFDNEDELTSELLFQGKNVKNDRLDLRVPIWITGILFVKLKEHTETSWHLITTTRYGQVRRYDTTHGRKPIFDKKISDKPLVHTTFTANEDEIICSDTHATTALFNVQKGLLVAKFKGSVGAVQDLYTHLNGDQSLLVTGSLDRYVRVFSIKTREQVAKIFVGSKISSVWLLDDKHEPVQSEQDDGDKKQRKKKVRKTKEEHEKEDEDVWNELNQLENKTTKRRKTVQ